METTQWHERINQLTTLYGRPIKITLSQQILWINSWISALQWRIRFS